MSQIVNFPPSMNLGQVKQPALNDMRPHMMQFRSQNQVYNARDTIIIPIPTGQKGMYLHPQDSFISFRFSSTHTATAGVVSLDATAYSIFRNARVRHGSNTLVHQRNCNRLWNALFDVQVSSGNREGLQNTLCINSDTMASRTANLYGTVLTSGQWYGASFTLPMAVVGSLQEKAIPLGWLNTSQLFIELDIDDMNRILTTREPTSDGTIPHIQGRAGQATALTLTSFQITDVVYHAKISEIGNVYDDLLLQSLGPSIAIPAVEWAGDEKFLGAGSNSINENFSFPFSSCKAFLWWMTHGVTAAGTTTSNNLRSAITQRAAGNLKEFNLSLNGMNYPPTPIMCDLNGATNGRGGINSSIVYQHLLRCFNLNSSSNPGGNLPFTAYTDADTTYADDATIKRFVAGIDLDRGDGNNDRFYQGTNTINQTVALRATFNSQVTEAHNIYAFMMHDIAFVLQDGLLSAQK